MPSGSNLDRRSKIMKIERNNKFYLNLQGGNSIFPRVRVIIIGKKGTKETSGQETFYFRNNFVICFKLLLFAI